MYLKKLQEGLLWDFSIVFQEVVLNEQWEQSIPCFEAGLAKVYEQELLAKCIQTALGESASRERILIQQYLGLDGTHNDGMTFQELAMINSSINRAPKRKSGVNDSHSVTLDSSSWLSFIF